MMSKILNQSNGYVYPAATELAEYLSTDCEECDRQIDMSAGRASIPLTLLGLYVTLSAVFAIAI